MERNTIVLILAVALVLGLALVNMIRRYFLAAQQLQLRRMIHDERMKAMAAGLAIPETSVYDELVTMESASLDIRRLRLAVLCAGLFLLFGGLGICLGFSLATEEHTSDAWSIGIIPAMAGIGLLLFYRLSASSDGLGQREDTATKAPVRSDSASE